jgi:hypothetical protein
MILQEVLTTVRASAVSEVLRWTPGLPHGMLNEIIEPDVFDEAKELPFVGLR